MGQDHTPEAEFARAIKRVALNPETYNAQPGQEVEVDFTQDSIYVHIPAIDPATGSTKTVGMNLLRAVFARPSA